MKHCFPPFPPFCVTLPVTMITWSTISCHTQGGKLKCWDKIILLCSRSQVGTHHPLAQTTANVHVRPRPCMSLMHILDAFISAWEYDALNKLVM